MNDAVSEHNIVRSGEVKSMHFTVSSYSVNKRGT
jgi:hypothetical protein